VDTLPLYMSVRRAITVRAAKVSQRWPGGRPAPAPRAPTICQMTFSSLKGTNDREVVSSASERAIPEENSPVTFYPWPRRLRFYQSGMSALVVFIDLARFRADFSSLPHSSCVHVLLLLLLHRVPAPPPPLPRPFVCAPALLFDEGPKYTSSCPSRPQSTGALLRRASDFWHQKK